MAGARAGACRVCALHCAASELLSMLAEPGPGPGRSTAELALRYLQLEVKENEMYPAVACKDCTDMLRTFHKFAIVCKNAQVFFQQQNQDYKLECCETVQEGCLTFVKEEVTTELHCSDFEIDNDPMPELKFDVDLQPKRELLLNEKKSERRNRRKYKTKFKSIQIKKERHDSSGCELEYGTNNAIDVKVRKAKLKRQKRMLMKTKNYECYICDESFKKYTEVRSHEKIAHWTSDVEKPWPCPHCDKSFRQRSKAIEHKKVKHDNTVMHVCDQCGRAFTKKANLDNHLNSVHQEEATYYCDDCPKKFKLKSALVRHLDSHSKKSFKCPTCALVLKSRRTLRNHILTHDKVGRQECSVCGKRFKTRKAIKVHMLVHTGETPFSCLWCSRKFANGSNCRIHKKRCHPTELYLHEAQLNAKFNDELEKRKNYAKDEDPDSHSADEAEIHRKHYLEKNRLILTLRYNQ